MTLIFYSPAFLSKIGSILNISVEYSGNCEKSALVTVYLERVVGEIRLPLYVHQNSNTVDCGYPILTMSHVRFNDVLFRMTVDDCRMASMMIYPSTNKTRYLEHSDESFCHIDGNCDIHL